MVMTPSSHLFWNFSYKKMINCKYLENLTWSRKTVDGIELSASKSIYRRPNDACQNVNYHSVIILWRSSSNLGGKWLCQIRILSEHLWIAEHHYYRCPNGSGIYRKTTNQFDFVCVEWFKKNQSSLHGKTLRGNIHARQCHSIQFHTINI